MLVPPNAQLLAGKHSLLMPRLADIALLRPTPPLVSFSVFAMNMSLSTLPLAAAMRPSRSQSVNAGSHDFILVHDVVDTSPPS